MPEEIEGRILTYNDCFMQFNKHHIPLFIKLSAWIFIAVACLPLHAQTELGEPLADRDTLTAAERHVQDFSGRNDDL